MALGARNVHLTRGAGMNVRDMTGKELVNVDMELRGKH